MIERTKKQPVVPRHISNPFDKYIPDGWDRARVDDLVYRAITEAEVWAKLNSEPVWTFFSIWTVCRHVQCHQDFPRESNYRQRDHWITDSVFRLRAHGRFIRRGGRIGYGDTVSDVAWQEIQQQRGNVNKTIGEML